MKATLLVLAVLMGSSSVFAENREFNYMSAKAEQLEVNSTCGQNVQCANQYRRLKNELRSLSALIVSTKNHGHRIEAELNDSRLLSMNATSFCMTTGAYIGETLSTKQVYDKTAEEIAECRVAYRKHLAQSYVNVQASLVAYKARQEATTAHFASLKTLSGKSNH